MKKTFSITNKIVLSHLRKQHNQSKYIEQLVINDLRSEKQSLTKDEVIELIQRYSGHKKTNTTVDDCVVNSVKSLFSL